MGATRRPRPDIFFVGQDGSMRSNRAFCQPPALRLRPVHRSTLQIDLQGNSSTATKGRIAGIGGGAPTWGADARGRRHASPALAARPDRRARHIAMPRARNWWCRSSNLPRAHAADLRRAPDAWDLAATAKHGAAAGDDTART